MSGQIHEFIINAMWQRAKVDNLIVCFRKKTKQTDVSFSCVCPVIDNEFRHNIVCGSVITLSADPRGSYSYFYNAMAKSMINNSTDTWKTDVNLLRRQVVE